MEYSMELYMAAKNMAVLNENKKKEEYDSLWDDEKKKKIRTRMKWQTMQNTVVVPRRSWRYPMSLPQQQRG